MEHSRLVGCCASVTGEYSDEKKNAFYAIQRRCDFL
jgi:hypothetical protein